jgi:3-oxoacyl-[acyl-carrier-protein] synthase III
LIHSKISFISYFLPEHILTNKDLVTIFPEKTEEIILKSFGIKKRHIREPKQTGSDLAYLAAQNFFLNIPILKRIK